ncbi:OmpL47-type beta-barrel domain-containing protein [Microbacterium sp. E-13]|uniref:OmpL47-type beta-barrel domain-containing protein n=1 Tax=Microbacterium sp. E-13 TaxID=3404048 RepID=UPI003CF37606
MLNVERSASGWRPWRLKALVAALVVGSGVAAAPITAQSASAADTALYVAPNGDDSADGSIGAPFRTIEHARDVVRTMNSGMTGDITVFLRGGTYPVSDTVRFGAQDSGSNGHRVIYSAYANEVPVLDAGVPVTGWTPHDGNIWVAPLERADKLRALYIDGSRAFMASKAVQSAGCYGTYSVTAGQAPWAWESGSKCDGASYALGDVPAIPRNAGDMELTTQTTWSTAITGIRGVTTSPDGTKRVALFQQPGAAIAQAAAYAPLQATGTHVLSNAYEFLDQPGEFFFDSEAQKVYLYPPAGTDPSTASISAPNHVETVLDISGTDRANRIHDVTFSGITVRHSDWNLTQIDGSSFKQTQQGNTVNLAFTKQNFHVYTYRNIQVEPGAVEVNSAADIEFIRNRVEHTGADGIQFVNDVVDSRIEGNVTNDIGGSALNIGDPQHVYIGDGTSSNREHYAPSVEGAPTNISVRNNYFYDSAVLFWGSAAISGYFLDTVAFENNRIEKTSWAGISLGWGWHNFDGGTGSVNPGNPTTVARNNSIQRNDIFDTMRFLSDSGPIYTLGSQPGTVIHDNYARGIRPGHTYGLHPDEGSAFISYDENVIEADPGIRYVINSGTWGAQHDLQIHNTWGPTSTIFNRNVPNSVIDPIRVVPDMVWPLQAYAVAAGAGVQSPYRDILTSVGKSADFALPASVLAPEGMPSLAVRGVGDATRTMWLAPAGTTSFASSATMTSAAGDATRIPVPSTNGSYKLYIVNADGTVSGPSSATVVRTPPRAVNQTLTQVTAGKCLDLPGATKLNGALPALYTCSGAVNQLFTLTLQSEISVYGNKCLDGASGGTTPGTAVVIWDCNGAASQKWVVNADGTIKATSSGLCLATVNGGTANGTRVQLATCSSTASAQKWKFPPSPDTVWTDTVAPVVSASTSPATADGAGGWFVSPVSVSVSASDPDSAAVSVEYRLGEGAWSAYSSPVPIPEGVTTFSSRATDQAGNVSDVKQLPVKADLTAPATSVVVSPGSGMVLAGSTVSATFTASDATSGVASTEYSTDGGTTWVAATAEGVSFTEVGEYHVKYRSVDAAGNVEQAREVTLTVVQPRTFTGFYAPVDMAGVVNVVKAGSTVPLKFELFFGEEELTSTTAIESLRTVQHSCDPAAPVDEIETVVTGGTALVYDVEAGRFQYNWKTPKGTTGCLDVIVRSTDGVELKAQFRLK